MKEMKGLPVPKVALPKLPKVPQPPRQGTPLQRVQGPWGKIAAVFGQFGKGR